ncbi:hypothetical protein PPSQR21_038350 [Paenibacillus polymyxa SQR-21]|uniref:replication initiation factor domain-containing protein n=1 Tax=Paenibacillus polymyxa TaxID=1406 RepID=UPI00042E8396|nr:replication initiation factor domain-containing protein [Paenibacillus polymyxa]AHM67473.1 hypothetical protein PPSQR21_038350 [Paenibacillus polymyxa SQR-21]
MDEETNNELVSLIDWLSFTLKTYWNGDPNTGHKPITLSAVYHLLGIPESEWVDMPKGLHGYHSQKACGDIRILYDGKSDMGIHVQFSGQGCRQWETYYGAAWSDLLGQLSNMDANFSRIDLAVDDIRHNGDKPYFRVGELIRRAKKGLCRSKWRTAKPIEKIKLADGSSQGKTIYYGSPSSKMQLRIYEKDYERLNDDQQLEENLTAWNRIELQLTDERAQATALFIQNGMETGEIILGILSHYINYVDDDGTRNKSRWPISQFWSDFLGDVGKLRLASKAPDKTIPQKASWLDNQVSATLSEVWYAMGSPGQDWFVEQMEKGMLKMSEAQWVRAEAFRDQMEVERASTIAQRQERYERYRELTDQRIAEYRQKAAEQYYMEGGFEPTYLHFQGSEPILGITKGDAATSPQKDLIN